MKNIFEIMTNEDGFLLMDGLEVRNLVDFKGHEQEELSQGDLYLNGEELGFISEDSWGGELQVNINNEKLKPIQDFIDKNNFQYHFKDKSFKISVEGYLSALLQAESLKKTIKNVKDKETYIYDFSKNRIFSYPYSLEDKTFEMFFKNKYKNEKIIVLNQFC